MQVSPFRKLFQGAALAATIAFAGATVPSAVSAQAPTDTGVAATRPMVMDDDVNEVDDDNDWGWLGLLGLAGLLGLRKRHVHHVDRVDHVDTTRRPL